MKQIPFKFYYSGMRNQCDVCGRWTDKFRLGASGDLGDQQSIYVCEDCIKNPSSLDQNLTDHIEGFRRYSDTRIEFIKSLRGRLDGLPSPTDWEKENAEINESWEEDAA